MEHIGGVLKPGVYIVSTRMHNQAVKITKRVLDRLPTPEKGQAFLRDSELKGFGVRITASGVATFIVEKRVDGLVRRVTLGRCAELKCEQARKLALRYLGQVASGDNPIAEHEKRRLASITLRQAFQDFKRARKSLKPKTLYEYERFLNTAFGDWKNRPLLQITKDKVAKRHRKLGEKRGEATANGAMRFLRALLNFAQAEYEDAFGQPLIVENAVKRLNQTRAWYRETRRRTVIKPHELPAWFKGVAALRVKDATRAETVADYLEFLLFTGLRRREAATLTWERVDLKDRTIVIPDPKNHEPLVLPLSNRLVAMLKKRREGALSGFVFQGEGRHGYLVEPKRQVQKVIEVSGVSFILHDLRRTFVTVAESLGIPPYSIKRLVNHKLRNDVTAGYIVTDIERLRGPMQAITDQIVKYAKKKGQVIDLDQYRKSKPEAS